MAKVEISEIESAKERISGYVLNTPLLNSIALSAKLGLEVFLKTEFLQETGSFKIRGATNAMLSLNKSQRIRGVITASSGNHGPALAHAASKLGIKATICLSSMVPDNKVKNVRINGGIVKIAGNDYDSALAFCEGLVKVQNQYLVHPFDDSSVVAGAGTIGLEIIEETRGDLDCVLVPLSGGGLLAGVAIAVKAYAPQIRIIGVSMENGASMFNSIKAGRPVNVTEVETVADALGGNIGLNNKWTFETVRDLVDEVVVVSENDIKEAIRLIFKHHGFVSEGAGAVGIAALTGGAVKCKGKVACVLSGRNISEKNFLDIVNNSGVN